MAESDSIFAGNIPNIYDEYLVPLIFDSYADDLAERVASLEPKSVLETAAGSGVVTRALAPRLSRHARYVASDLNQPMIDRAASMQPANNRIVWKQADALNLPFQDEGFDVVCCQFGVMFFPDKVEGYKSACRVLQDGGRFVFNVWDKIEENEFARSVTDSAATCFPDNPPMFLARTPHGYHDVGTIEAELFSAGFRHIEFETIANESRAENARQPAIAYCQGTPLLNELEARDPARVTEITELSAANIEREFGLGPISGKIQGHVIVATK